MLYDLAIELMEVLQDEGTLVRFRKEGTSIKIEELSGAMNIGLVRYEPFEPSALEHYAQERGLSMANVAPTFLYCKINSSEEMFHEQETEEEEDQFIKRCLELFPELRRYRRISHSFRDFGDEIVNFIQSSQKERLLFFN